MIRDAEHFLCSYDEGMRCFAEALESGALQACQELILSGNQIGEDGMRSVAQVRSHIR